MVFEGDLDGYVIRSAGPDSKFATEDDIYLKGNMWGEHVMDGSSRRTLSSSALKRQFNKLPFQDPTGYYHVSLPGSYIVIDEFDNGQSNITFFYARDNYVRIIAEPYSAEWDAEEEMRDRIDDIQLGRDDELLGFSVQDYGPVQVGNGNGFMIRLESPGFIVQEYVLLRGFYMRVSALIMASGNDREEIVSILSRAVESNLEIH
jgi:hypothetical protein